MTAITPALAAANPPLLERPGFLNAIKKDFIYTTLKELGVVLAYTAILTPVMFPATSIVATLILGVGVVAINTIFRAFAAYRASQLPEADERVQGNIKADIEAADTLSAWSFGAFDTMTRDTLFHELGHATTASIVYQGASPTVRVFANGGGVTSYYASQLTTFGKILGEKGSAALVAGAGAGVSVAVAYGSIIYHHYNSGNNPRLAKYTLMSAIQSIVHVAMYAISALYMDPKKNPGHDFIALHTITGIHPLFWAFFAIAGAVILKTVLIAGDMITSSRRQT